MNHYQQPILKLKDFSILVVLLFIMNLVIFMDYYNIIVPNGMYSELEILMISSGLLFHVISILLITILTHLLLKKYKLEIS